MKTGEHLLKAWSPARIEEELSGEKYTGPCGGMTDDQMKAILLGCRFCNVTRPENTIVAMDRLRQYAKVEAFLKEWDADGLTVPWTRITADMLFEARNGDELKYRRFSALCAANAAIGSKPFASVTRNRLRAGMLGYPRGRTLFDKSGKLTPDGILLLERRSDKAQPITPSQARTLFDNFVKTGLLFRFAPGHGDLTYYSKKLEPEKIAAAISTRAIRRAGNPANSQKLGEDYRRAKLGRSPLRGEVSGKSPRNGDSPHNEEIAAPSPPVNRPFTAQSPHNVASNAALNAAEKAAEKAPLAVSVESPGNSAQAVNPNSEQSRKEVGLMMQKLRELLNEKPLS